MNLSDRAMLVALTGEVQEDDPHIIADMMAEIDRLRAALNAIEADDPHVMMAEIDRLRAVLKALVDDVLEYERINNLSPSPGRKDCWQSVTNAKTALNIK